MRPGIFILITLISLLPASGSRAQGPVPPQDRIEQMRKITEVNKDLAARTSLMYLIIRTAENTYGYDIFADGHLYIHQPVIPALPGTRGFPDTASAGAVARLTIEKIRKGLLPPTITAEELRALKIIR